MRRASAVTLARLLDTTEARIETPRGEDAGRVMRLLAFGDRHPVAIAVVAAAVARIAFAVGSFVLTDGVLVPDEQQYIELADTVARGLPADTWYPFYGQSLYDSTYAFAAPLARLFDLFWTSRIFGQLIAAIAGVALVAITSVIALRTLGRRAALTAGAVAALLPSQVLFSSVSLRESMVWASIALVGLGVVLAAPGSRRGLLTGAACAASGLLALGSLRDQTLVAVAWALAASGMIVPWFPRRGRLPRAAGGVVLALLIPWFVGIGPGGWQLMERAVPMLGVKRTALAVGADTAITPTSVVAEPGQVLSVPPGGSPGDVSSGPPTTSPNVIVADGARRYVRSSDGNVYEVEESLSANVRQFPRGFLATTLRPFVWDERPNLTVALAMAENVIWYVLYVFAAVGVVRNWRYGRLVAFPLLSSSLIIGIAAVSQGNVGTAFRHRGQVLWALAILAAAAFGGTAVARNQADQSTRA